MRNSKHEARNPKQYQNSNVPNSKRAFGTFGFMISNLFRNSKFEIRNFTPTRNIFVGLLIAAFFILPFIAYAQGGLVPCGGPGQDPCSICDFGILIINITNFLIYNIAIPLAGLMIVVGGAMIMFGAASEQRVATGKKILTNAIIGAVIVFIAWLMVDTVIKVLTGSYAQRSFFGTFGPWNKIPPGACPFGGGISPQNPTPVIQAPATAPIIFPSGPSPSSPSGASAPSPGSSSAPPAGSTPVPQPPVTDEEFSDEIFDNATITVDPAAGKVAVQGEKQTGTFDIKEGAGIAFVRETYPNVFIMGKQDLSLQDATRLKAALDEAASLLPSSYNVKDKIILVPTDDSLNTELNIVAGGTEELAKYAKGLISKNNVIIWSDVAHASNRGMTLAEYELNAGALELGAVYDLRSVVIHELAHVQANKETGFFQYYAEWGYLHVRSRVGNTGFVSPYAKTNANEDLAETVMVASLALDGKSKAYTGNPEDDAILKAKYEYLAKNGLIKAVPPRQQQ